MKESLYTQSVERYLTHDMNIDEERDFFKQLKCDRDLRKEFDIQCTLMSAIYVNETQKCVKEKKKSSKIRKSVTLSLLIGLALSLAACVSMDYSRNKDLAGGELDNIKEFRNQSGGTTRGANDIMSVLDLYWHGEEDLALQKIDSYVKNNPNSDCSDYLYVKGLILLKKFGHKGDAVRSLRQADTPRSRQLLDKIWFSWLW